ncbi:GNAT family N-acetyltransferase [Haloarchaeobius sp. HRN-SO-5]|uniref:GNAT family N-acetyltransferase n=1 Tax=Haloarchaeobius sp. HRN-SO-5 TaxID=3446118 RepID=UPI003EBFF9E1
MSTDACAAWSADGCEGTPHCPPRCPRFVDRVGRSYLVQQLTADAVEDALELYRDYPEEHRSMGLPPREERAVRDWLTRMHRRGTNLLAWDGDRVVGHTGFAPDDGAEPEFLVYVDPAYHGRGVGSELTRQAIAYAADAGHDALVLHVDDRNEAAVAVYRKHGFVVEKREAMELRMRLPLDVQSARETGLAPAART